MMHVFPPKPTIAEVLTELAARLKPFPVFPDCFGPRDRSPHVDYFTRRLLDPIAEAKRVRARQLSRKDLP